jgi:hypothetical protein
MDPFLLSSSEKINFLSLGISAFALGELFVTKMLISKT